MSRAVLEPLAFFFAPFAVYAIFLMLRSRYPLEVEHWTSARVSILTLAGLAAAVLSLLAVNLLSPRGHGVYVPAREVNGVLVPGHFE